MNPLTTPLLTDLYQLTMLQSYYARGMRDTAVFEFFIRKLPPFRNFMLAAGLAQVMDFLEKLRFDEPELRWVAGNRLFRPDFIKRLEALRFTGDVYAMPEGTIFFPSEPIIRVVAPMPEAQLIESRLINLVHFETLVATKAARSVLAAPGKELVEFGLRRAHGAEAALLASRATYISGFAGTATVLSAPLFDIPLFGTMAHSYIQAHDDESDAFADFARAFPHSTIFLIDTYDTEAAAHKLVTLAPRLAEEGIMIKGVRLDSGDLATQARNVRRILDAGGLERATIFASGNLDEYRLRDLLTTGAPIDGFGVGTSLVTSADAPFLDAVYKLQEYAGKPRRKRSTGKATWPGRKQVYRTLDRQERFDFDIVTTSDDVARGEALLIQVMSQGKRVCGQESLDTIRRRAAAQLGALPDRLRVLEPCPEPYSVQISPRLQQLAAQVDRSTGAGCRSPS